MKCRVCKEEKPLDAFGESKHLKSGINSMCKACGAKQTKAYRNAHPESIARDNNSPAGKAKIVRYRQRNKDKLNAIGRARYLKNRESILAAAKENTHKKEVERLWRIKNKETINARIAAWAKANPHRGKERTARYRKRYPDKQKEQYQKLKLENPSVLTAKCARRRAMKKNAHVEWANQFFIGEIYHLAKLRTKATGFKWEVDHIYPLQSDLVCGLHVENNLQVVPLKVNRAKQNKVFDHG